MPILPLDGRHKLSTTDWICMRLGRDQRGSHILHFGSSSPATGTRSLPTIVGAPLGKTSTHQEKLEEEYNYVPA